jgi:hypothetical protein
LTVYGKDEGEVLYSAKELACLKCRMSTVTVLATRGEGRRGCDFPEQVQLLPCMLGLLKSHLNPTGPHSTHTAAATPPMVGGDVLGGTILDM